LLPPKERNRSVNLFNEADFNEASLAEEESPKRGKQRGLGYT